MSSKPFLSQKEAVIYLSERLPYPVRAQDVCKWYRDNLLRGEKKGGGNRVYYTAQALDDFVTDDEARRTNEHLHKKASAKAAENAKLTKAAKRSEPIATLDDFRALARA